MMALPTTTQKRKEVPIATGVLDYFPDAIAAVAEVSYKGNQQHNPGEPTHWDRSKSPDEADALVRHFMERGTVDTDGIAHSAKMAWRALALLQKEIEGRTGSDNMCIGVDQYTQSMRQHPAHGKVVSVLEASPMFSKLERKER